MPLPIFDELMASVTQPQPPSDPEPNPGPTTAELCAAGDHTSCDAEQCKARYVLEYTVCETCGGFVLDLDDGSRLCNIGGS